MAGDRKIGNAAGSSDRTELKFAGISIDEQEKNLNVIASGEQPIDWEKVAEIGREKGFIVVRLYDGGKNKNPNPEQKGNDAK